MFWYIAELWCLNHFDMFPCFLYFTKKWNSLWRGRGPLPLQRSHELFPSCLIKSVRGRALTLPCSPVTQKLRHLCNASVDWNKMMNNFKHHSKSQTTNHGNTGPNLLIDQTKLSLLVPACCACGVRPLINTGPVLQSWAGVMWHTALHSPLSLDYCNPGVRGVLLIWTPCSWPQQIEFHTCVFPSTINDAWFRRELEMD